MGSRNQHLNQAKELAQDALMYHREGIAKAGDHLRKTIEDVGVEAKKLLRVHVREIPSKVGMMHMVSMRGQASDGNHYDLMEVLVATKQLALKVTDSANATPVSFQTKVASILYEEDGSQHFVELWDATATQAVQ